MPVKRQLTDADNTLPEAPCWLPMYAALCMVLLAVFVIPYPMSAPDSRKDLPQAPLREQAAAIRTRAYNDIRAFIAQNAMEDRVEATLEKNSITLRLPERALFAPGAEQVLPAGLHTLNTLKELFLIHNQQTIHIRCYADDSPPLPGTRFKDNWELSVLRAAHVLRHLLAQGIEPGRLTATGFGDLEPLFPNTTEENRAKNRRIEFVLERRLENE